MSATLDFLQFPCSHQQNSNVVPRVVCRLNFQEFERLVTYDVNQRHVVPLTPYRLITSTEIDPFNPFCGHCRYHIIGLMKSFGHSDERSNNLWREIKENVYNKLCLSLEFDYSGQEIWDIHAYTDLLCDIDDDEAALREWAERVSFEEEVIKATPATKVAIEALTRSVIKDYEEDTNCVICLKGLYDSKKQGALKVTMPCKHEFHEGCIVEWLHHSHFCPLCRFELPVSV